MSVVLDVGIPLVNGENMKIEPETRTCPRCGQQMTQERAPKASEAAEKRRIWRCACGLIEEMYSLPAEFSGHSLIPVRELPQ